MQNQFTLKHCENHLYVHYFSILRSVRRDKNNCFQTTPHMHILCLEETLRLWSVLFLEINTFGVCMNLLSSSFRKKGNTEWAPLFCENKSEINANLQRTHQFKQSTNRTWQSLINVPWLMKIEFESGKIGPFSRRRVYSFNVINYFHIFLWVYQF